MCGRCLSTKSLGEGLHRTVLLHMFLSFFITPLPQGSGRSVLIYSSLDVLQTHVWALARSTRNGRLKFWKVFVAMSCTWGSDWVAGCEVAGRPEARAGPLDPAHAGRPVGQLVWLLACLFAPIVHISSTLVGSSFVPSLLCSQFRKVLGHPTTSAALCAMSYTFALPSV